MNRSSPKTTRFSVMQLLSWLAVAALVVGVALIAFNFPITKYNGLSLSVDGQSFQPTTWLWVDAVTIWDGDKPVVIQGYLWNDTAGDHTFSVTSDGAVEIRLGGELAYARQSRVGVTSESFTADLPAGAVPTTVNYRTADPPTPRFEVSLSENGRLIAPWRLYPTEPTAELVARQRWTWLGLYFGLGLLALSGILSTIAVLRNLKRNDALIAAGIVALAIAVRVAVAVERYYTGSDFYAMTWIWDNFVVMARGVIAGSYSLPGSYAQQGAIIYLTLVQAALGPALLPQYIISAVLGGLTCGFTLGAAWALFGRPSGLLAGTMMALYAPMIHYQTTLQIVVPATTIASIGVAFGAWLIRRPNANIATAFGINVGLGMLTRGPLIAFALSGLSAINLTLTNFPWRRKLLLSGVMILSIVLTILPMTLGNISIGIFSVSTGKSSFPIAFFRGNHRDTFGIGEYMTDREKLARARAGDEINLNSETFRDIRADPGHWIQQMIHKAALFWSAREYSDLQIDFYSSGVKYSAILRVLWLGGVYSLTMIAGLGGLGALLAAREPQHRPAILFLGSALALGTALTSIFTIAGRVRNPFFPALFPLSAFGSILLVQELRRFQQSWRYLAVAAFTVAAALLIVRYIETQLPYPTVVSRVPPATVETDVDFDSRVRLIGYDAFDSDFRSGGYLDVTLYWRALKPLDSDYTLFIHLLNPSYQRLGGIDRPLGDANFPIYLASKWKPGEIVRQSYYVPLPKIEGAVPMRIIVGLYDSNQQRLPITSSAVEILDGTAAMMTGLSILPEPTPLPALARPLEISAGSELKIAGTDIPATLDLDPGASAINVQLDWQAQTHPSYRYHLFLHLLDANGNLVSQFDGPPVADFPTDTWPPLRTWRGSYQIVLPHNLAAGEYALTAGLYRIGDLQRIPLSGAQELLLRDNRFLLSTIRIAP